LLAAISVILGLAVFAIFWFSRRKLRRASAARRRAQLEFAAILGERNRIAREVHDTLAQGLGAILLQHEMLKDHLPGGSEAENHLIEANEITRDCMTEARESIWNMRSQVLEKNDLPTALAGVLDQLTDSNGIEVGFDLKGTPFRLPPVVENNLLRIGQEAITNAVKHAAAKRIDVIVEYSPRQVTLRVKDDGRGFDPATVQCGNTHFGLIGLRERSAELGATIHFKASPGHGTEVVLKYPISKPLKSI
jgi:signal transduction histidine kinase